MMHDKLIIIIIVIIIIISKYRQRHFLSFKFKVFPSPYLG